MQLSVWWNYLLHNKLLELQEPEKVNWLIDIKLWPSFLCVYLSWTLYCNEYMFEEITKVKQLHKGWQFYRTTFVG